MAELVATQLAQRNGLSKKIHFESAGTHASKSKMQIDNRAVAVLEGRGYTVKKIRSRRIEIKDFKRFDLILAMDNKNYNELLHICPSESQRKLKMFLAESTGININEVPDPYYGNSEGFERVLDLCETGAQGLLRSISAY